MAENGSNAQGDIGLNLYDFYVRHPGETTKKYSMRIYDDCIMAPYVRLAPSTFPLFCSPL